MEHELITKIYINDCEQSPELVDAMTFRDWLSENKLLPGMFIVLGDENGNMTESFIIGDCTMYMQPSNNDGGIGWDDSHPRFDHWVLEVHEPQLVYSKPCFK